MKMRTLMLPAVLLAFLGAAGVAGAGVDAPRVTTAKLKAPLPLPYDESADAAAAVAKGIAKAKASGKYVLLDLGGNWCPDCRILAGVLELGEVASAISKTFEVVAIDVGRMDKNLEIAAAYGVKVRAVPTVIILDPAGRFVNAGNPTALSNARAMTPQAIVDTIYGWIAAAN